MPPRCRKAMFLDHANFPVPILYVLLEQAPERRSRLIPTPDTPRLIDRPSRSFDAEVQFVILIANKLFVKATYFLKRFLSPAPEVHGVDRPFVIRVMGARASRSKPRVENRRNRAIDEALSRRIPGSPDVVRSGLAQHRHALP